MLTITATISYLPSTPGLSIYLLLNDAVAIPDTNSNTTSEKCIGKHTEVVVS